MRIFNILLIMLVIVILSGCSNTREPEIITKTEIQEVYVPVKPLRPRINCDFTGTGNEPIAKLLDCVIIQKRVLMV